MRPAFRHALVLALLGSAAGACDHWPGVDDTPSGGLGNAVGPTTAPGTCSGTPLPCGALGGQDCSTTSGCMDQGSCAGTSAVAGEPCGTALSFQSCGAIPGCFWSPSCVGTPLGTCSGFTEASCLLAQGCVFTPSGAGGSSSSGGLCTTFGQSCTSAGNCDCGFSCVQQCATCRAACGTPCISDGDCTGAMGTIGRPTPYCVGLPSPPVDPFTGTCASAR